MTEPPPQLRISLTAPESVTLGSIVPIVIHLENVGETPLELYLRGRTIAYDVVIEDATGEVVWRRLEGEIIPGIIQIKVLDSGEVLELSHGWDQRSNRGYAIEPGLFTVRGSVLTDSPEPIVSPAKPLLVVPKT
jgi:hypothetical protein